MPEVFETVFDPIRRVRVKLTPEERVRQSVVFHLTHALGYPPELISNECAITVGKTLRRCDTVVFAPRDRTPLMILEYKAPEVPVSAKTVAQALEYNSVLSARVIVVTNGRTMSVLRCHEGGGTQYLDAIPQYESLIGSDLS
ncbi:MAG: type I restriction enzyme HsdR N-terminal domain-containing protein [Porphyromonas sp.]|nr:type I restriction enzyme HsdR N-terminal domain-containing protein [Bacteroidales bacterium]MDD7559738.1 type I restriction enzyme HsdR N-terminal domain-containing protein [Bacteroidales bacterium]MDY3100222.1 type I restriction enzyme HsdR N-terminal domain-containing protein [Porphyromonas sp.]